MPTYNTPGVYIQEIATLPPSVAPVATAVPAFIGYVESFSNGAAANVAVRISSLLEYEQYFGKAQSELNLEVTFAGTSATVGVNPSLSTKFNLYYSLQMYFANGGGPCWIVGVKTYAAATSGVSGTEVIAGLDAISKIDEPTLLLFPDAVSLGATYDTVVEAALLQCNTLQDRFVIADYVGADVTLTNLNAYRSSISSPYLKYGAAYGPNLKTSLTYRYTEVDVAIAGVSGSTDLAALKTANLELYNKALVALNQYTVTVPASGAIAGIYCAVDRDRGVWKAPANIALSNVIAPAINISEAEQGLMNVDATSGKSINAIRSFTGKGTLVWGARTLAGNDNEWRYVNVRRLFNFAEESIKKATEFSVFEPNDRNTWTRVRTTISNFLTNLWRDGALVGATPEQAFFVRVGLGETMTAQDILEGKMIIAVGLAASRPAEFITINFSHKLQEA
ncbi:MAG: phage tail sheath family protein [Bacteroidota bacterium]